MEKNYLIIDLGTGNSRVGLASSAGRIYGIKSFENIYYKDERYEDARYFLPEEWKGQILEACLDVVKKHSQIQISAIISSGARESVVLYDKNGQAFYGLPNIDNRGRKWVDAIPDKGYIYERTGRWVTEDFPAAKLLGYRMEQPGEYRKIGKITSLSEWIGEVFTGKIVIEPSQACETQLFDIETLKWSEKICDYYGIDREILPPIQKAGSSLGQIRPEQGKELNLPLGVEFIVGGADTQIAVKGTGLKSGDLGFVSGTTSPVVTIVDYKYYDEMERCWTDLNLGGNTYQIETNPGVTGLNYQKMKKMLFPDMSYAQLDEWMNQRKEFICTASFSTLNFTNKQSLKKGGFVMHTPFDSSCELIDLLWSAIADIACSIYVQYHSLCEMVPHDKSYILGCGGGFQSGVLCGMIADLTGKELIVYSGFEQASIKGCIRICNEYYGIDAGVEYENKMVYAPHRDSLIHDYFPEWRGNRDMLNLTYHIEQ